MTVRNQTVKVNRGDTAALFVALTNADGTPYDPSLTVVLKWRLARNAFAPEDQELVRKNIGDGLTIEDGGVTIELDAADTDFPPGLYYHELKVFDDPDVSTAMTGTFVIVQVLDMTVVP